MNKDCVRYYVRQWVTGKGWCDGCGVFRTERTALREANSLKKAFPYSRFAVVRVATKFIYEV